MPEHRTINLTSIPPKSSKKLVKHATTFKRNKWFYNLVRERMNRYREKLNDQYEDWLRQSNHQILEGIDKFIDTSLNADKSKFFAGSPESVELASLVLGMQTGDHIPTIQMIEGYVLEKFRKIHVIRLPSDLDKKTNLINILEDKGYGEHNFVIIERFETFKNQLLEVLVLILSDAIRSKRIVTAMILVCMSIGWIDIATYLPPGVSNRVGSIVQLVKDSQGIDRSIRMQLLRGDDREFKFGPDLFQLIDFEYEAGDASFANMKYLCHYIMLQHFMRPTSLLASDTETLKKIPKAELTEIFDELSSIKDHGVKARNLIKYCTDSCNALNRYHQFIFNQISYYFIMLYDETRYDGSFPHYIQEIYTELANHDDLGQSIKVCDAISRLNNPQMIIDRVKMCEEHDLEHPDIDIQDVYTILVEYKEKLEVAKNKLPIVKDFMNELRSYASSLQNPLKFPLHEAIYSNQAKLVQSRCIPATRSETLSDFSDETKPFGVLYKIIHGSTETISLADLYEDFKAKLDIDEEEGLIKALFLDLIDAMIHQGLIKTVKRGAHKDMIKKCVWL